MCKNKQRSETGDGDEISKMRIRIHSRYLENITGKYRFCSQRLQCHNSEEIDLFSVQTFFFQFKLI